MWRDTYTTALGLERASAMLARALSVDFDQQYSVTVGEFFRAAVDDPVIEVKINYMDQGELADPALPEGVYVTATGQADSPLRAALGALAWLTLVPSPGGEA